MSVSCSTVDRPPSPLDANDQGTSIEAARLCISGFRTNAIGVGRLVAFSCRCDESKEAQPEDGGRETHGGEEVVLIKTI